MYSQVNEERMDYSVSVTNKLTSNLGERKLSLQPYIIYKNIFRLLEDLNVNGKI